MITQTGPENKKRRFHITGRQLFYTFLAVLGLSSCAPATIPPPDIDQSGLPPRNSPYYTNDGSMNFLLVNSSTTSAGGKRTLTVSTYCQTNSGSSCDDRVATSIGKPNKEQKNNNQIPFNVVVSRGDGDDIVDVAIQTTEAIGSSISPSSDPIHISISFDQTAPQIQINPNTSPGTIIGTATDGSPLEVVEAKECGEGVPMGDTLIASDGSFGLVFVPRVGENNCVELSVKDAAGNIGQTKDNKPYNFDAGFLIHTILLDDPGRDLNELSGRVGQPVTTKDYIVTADLPPGIDPATVKLSGKQGNFGLTATFDCPQIGLPNFDVSFLCTPNSKGGTDMKITFTDQYGYSFQEFYPDLASFEVPARKMTLGEQIWYYTKIFSAVLSASILTGLVVRYKRRKKEYGIVKEKANDFLQLGLEDVMVGYVSSLISLDQRQKDRLLADLKIRKSEIESSRRKKVFSEHLTVLKEYLRADRDYTIEPVTSEELREIVKNLNEMRKLGFVTHELSENDTPDVFIMLERFSRAFNVLLDQLPELSRGKNWWNAVREKLNVETKINEMEEILARLLVIQVEGKYKSLWSMIKKQDEDLAKRMIKIGIIHAEDMGILSEKAQVYTELITHNKVEIEEVIQWLIDWNSPVISKFIEKIRIPNEKAKAFEYFQKHCLAVVS